MTFKSYFLKSLKWSFAFTTASALLSARIENYFGDYVKVRIDDLGQTIWLFAITYSFIALLFFSLQFTLLLLPLTCDSFRDYIKTLPATFFTFLKETLVNFGKATSLSFLFIIPGIWTFLKLSYTYHAALLIKKAIIPQNIEAKSAQDISALVFKENKLKTVIYNILLYFILPTIGFFALDSNQSSLLKEIFVSSTMSLVYIFIYYGYAKVFINYFPPTEPTQHKQESANGANISMATN